MRALLLVDLQNDFMPDGALPVPRGDQVVPTANSLLERFDLKVASKDWHPPDHLSFASQHASKRPGDRIELEGLDQTLWPDHCVQGTPGAEFHPALHVDRLDHIVLKGTDRKIDSYSAFYDNARRRSTGLTAYLRERQVDEIVIMGLATDYCVLFSALDAVRDGFEVKLAADGCRGIGLQPGDVQRALDKMRDEGVAIVHSEEL